MRVMVRRLGKFVEDRILMEAQGGFSVMEMFRSVVGAEECV